MYTSKIRYYYVKLVKYSKITHDPYFERIYGIWHVYKFCFSGTCTNRIYGIYLPEINKYMIGILLT